MSLANKVTLSRLLLTGVFLFLLYNITLSSILLETKVMWFIIFTLFLIIAILDIVDGFLARLYNEVSSLGRMLDPFVDKIFIICSYIIFGSYHLTKDIIPLWVVLLVLFRELLIQGIRHYCEGKDIEFGSNVFGKQKMLIQSIVLGGLILYVYGLKVVYFYKVFLKVIVYYMLLVTILSGLIYMILVLKSLSKVSVLKN